MEQELAEVFLKECYSRVQTLQLSKADLPQRFEDALQATNIAIQEQYTEKQNQRNSDIQSMTRIKNTIIEAPKEIQRAEGQVSAFVANNKAALEAFKQVTETEA